MKKLLSFLLVITLITCGLAIPVNATAKSVYRDGAVFVVTHHNPKYPTDGVSEQERNDNHVLATGELCEKITSLTYAEILMFDINTLYVGLPYDAVDKVAELDTVDSVVPYVQTAVSTKAPQDKISTDLAKIIEESSPDDILEGLTVILSYNAMVYYGFCEEDFDDPQDYLVAKRAANKEYHTKMNQQIFEQIQKEVDIISSNTSVYYYSPFIIVDIKVSEIEKLSKLPQVNGFYEPQPEEPWDDPSEPPLPTDTKYKYKQKFNSFIDFPEYIADIHGGDNFAKYYDYDELYEHMDDSSNVDWALITAKVNLFDPWEVVGAIKIGNRAIKWWLPGVSGHGFGLFVYDAEQDTFYDIDRVDVDDYEGLVDAFEQLQLGDMVGDVDMDKTISIMDATAIQMYLSNLLDYNPSDNAYEYVHILGDVDDDGEMSILDATALQMKLALLEN